MGRALGYWPLRKTEKRRGEKRLKIKSWVNSYQGLVIDMSLEKSLYLFEFHLSVH